MPTPDALREAEREAKALIATAPRYCTLAEAVDAYRDAVAAEARAALLAGAPEVWVARDDDGTGWMFDTPPKQDRNGDWEVPDFDHKEWALQGLVNMPLGTCVRYRLVPDPESPRDAA